MLIRSYARFLKKRFPEIKVSIRRTRVPKGLHGDCDFVSGKFLIRLDNKDPESTSIWTLTHEFPHTMSWDEWVATGKHGPKYVKAYERVYRAYEDWVEFCSKTT
jgi:hypothetical protein